MKPARDDAAKTIHVNATANAALQNTINRSIIFNYLRENAPCHRAQISKNLRISAPAVSRAISRLIDEGYVTETARAVLPNGKSARRLVVNPGSGIVVGIDLIKDPIRVSVSDLAGSTLLRRRGFRFGRKTDVQREIEAEIDRAIEQVPHLSRAGRGRPRLRAIAVGVPAVIEGDSGKVQGASLYRTLLDVNLKETLERKYRVPAFIENVVKLSALAEKNYGLARGSRNLVFVEISTGIGAGIVLENHLLRGADGSAGEIGFSLVGTDSLRYRVRTKGFLENHASVAGIREAARKGVRGRTGAILRDLAGRDMAQLTAALVLEAASRGDGLSRRILTAVVEQLAVVFSNMMLVLNPDAFIIGGEICSLPHVEELVVRPIRRLIEGSIPFRVAEVQLSKLGEDAGVIGAVYSAVESLLARSFPYRIERARSGTDRGAPGNGGPVVRGGVG
jgi:predicted NBD/HSP70 family sugar kinase